ncbi:hypothetical protein ACFLTG_00005, partial [Chloroflexota bacterium]
LVGAVVTEIIGSYAMATRGMRTMYGDEGSCNAASATAGKNREIADLIKSSLAEPDLAKRFEMHARVVRMAMDMHMVVVIGGIPPFGAVGPRLDFDPPAVAPWTILQLAEYFKHK